ERNEKPAMTRAFAVRLTLGRQRGNDIFGLQALVALHDRKLHPLPLDQHAVTFATDGAEVDEDILPGIAGNKAESLGGVEPLHGSGLPAMLADDRAGVGLFVLGQGGSRLWGQVASEMQQGGDKDGQQAQPGSWLAADAGQRCEKDKTLQNHGKNEQG